jgi:hypothetical protein
MRARSASVLKTRTPLRALVSALGLAALFFVPQVLQAGIIAYEGFDYTAAANWDGVANSTPWPSSGQNWTKQPSNASPAIQSGNLSYSELQAVGNKLQLVGDAAMFRQLGTSYNTQGNHYWFSALFSVVQGAGVTHAGISLFNLDSSVNTEELFFGQRHQTPNWGMEFFGGKRANSSISSAGGAVGFLVLEIDGVNKKANLYVNPSTLGGSPPAVATLTISGDDFGDFSFNNFRVKAGLGETLEVDELRFGTSYGDVTPQQAVPEPGSFALALGLGIVAMIGWRRRGRAT